MTPERAVLVVPVLAGLGISVALLSVGITPLMLRVREQSEVVAQLTTKADYVPVLRQQLEALKRKQLERERQLDRLLDLVAGTSELQTFLAELNDMARQHHVEITTTKPGTTERFRPRRQLWLRSLHQQPVAGPLKKRLVIQCLIAAWRNVRLFSR